MKSKTFLNNLFFYNISFFVVCLAIHLFSAPAAAASPFPETIEHQGVKFQKCKQARIKAMMVFKVGQAALYLENCSPSKSPLDGNVLFTINYSMDFKPEDFKMSSLELLRRNTSENTFNQIKSSAEAFNDNYLGVEKGDQYYVISTNNELDLLLNGTPVSESTDAQLAREYFSIWFGDKPFNKKLKKQLLSSLVVK